VDLTLAACFGAAGLISGGTVLVRNWPHDRPGSDTIIDVFTEMDGYVVTSDAGLTVTSRSTSGVLGPIAAMVRAVPDLIPLIVVLATQATGVSRLTGVTEKQAADAVRNVRRLGGAATASDGEVVVAPCRPTGGLWDSEGSIPLAVAGAVLGLVTPGVEVAGWDGVEGADPGITAEWLRMISADEYLVPGSAKLPHEYVH
jgi:3-phosphoshikimate 1-carboxyvinyltransferase